MVNNVVGMFSVTKVSGAHFWIVDLVHCEYIDLFKHSHMVHMVNNMSEAQR